MELKDLSKDEKSLLLFLETCAVDKSGRVNVEHMNAQDMEIAKRWNESGFLGFGRICHADCKPIGTHWTKLSPEAFTLCGQEREARAGRKWEAKSYVTTEEKRQAQEA